MRINSNAHYGASGGNLRRVLVPMIHSKEIIYDHQEDHAATGFKQIEDAVGRQKSVEWVINVTKEQGESRRSVLQEL